MDPHELDANPEVKYVLVLNKGPVLLIGALIFGYCAYWCYNEWTKLSPSTEPDE